MTESRPKKRRNFKYSLHLVTYLDILGFRDLVSEESPNFISTAIRRVIEATAPDKKNKKQYGENYVNFSDLIVHTIPVYSRANMKYRIGLVFDRVQSLLYAQVALIEEGLLVRGALTLGDVERTYKVLFGPGVIAAYDLERKKARVPWIIVDPALLDALKTNPSLRRHKYKEEMEYLSSWLKMDNDDELFFIDYLGGLYSEYDATAYARFLITHRKLIERGLVEFADDPKILPKYLWLKNYHNETVRIKLEATIQNRYLV
jgi:hypothetical protein